MKKRSRRRRRSESPKNPFVAPSFVLETRTGGRGGGKKACRGVGVEGRGPGRDYDGLRSSLIYLVLPSAGAGPRWAALSAAGRTPPPERSHWLGHAFFTMVGPRIPHEGETYTSLGWVSTLPVLRSRRWCGKSGPAHRCRGRLILAQEECLLKSDGVLQWGNRNNAYLLSRTAEGAMSNLGRSDCDLAKLL